jgi:hypothetical protein
MITPTVGRVVWYVPGKWATDTMLARKDGQPLAGHVAYVWNERMVNLMIIDHEGCASSRTLVALLQDDDVPPADGGYAQWMPYQKGQAAKYEELEKQKAAG